MYLTSLLCSLLFEGMKYPQCPALNTTSALRWPSHDWVVHRRACGDWARGAVVNLPHVRQVVDARADEAAQLVKLVKRMWSEEEQVWRSGALNVSLIGDGTLRLNGDVMQMALDKGGFSVVFNRMNWFSRPLRRVVRRLQHDAIVTRVNANVYVTPPNSAAFEAHFDWMDSIVVQLEGCKIWEFGGFAVRSPARWHHQPIRHMPGDVQCGGGRGGVGRDDNAVHCDKQMLDNALSLKLCAGDMMVLPAGLVHKAETLGLQTGSVHVTFGIEVDAALTMVGFAHGLLGMLHATVQDHMCLCAMTQDVGIGVPLRQPLPWIRREWGGNNNSDLLVNDEALSRWWSALVALATNALTKMVERRQSTDARIRASHMNTITTMAQNDENLLSLVNVLYGPRRLDGKGGDATGLTVDLVATCKHSLHRLETADIAVLRAVATASYDAAVDIVHQHQHQSESHWENNVT